ncbi:MAG: DUF2252 family protein, partial [Tepidisphaeraceae bacterium]
GKDDTIQYTQVLAHAIRAKDPFVRVSDKWIVRRLAPHCSRIDLTMLPKQREEKALLRAMGWETANVHLGSEKAKVLLSYLGSRESGWLLRAAQDMRDEVEKDWRQYKKG